MTRAIMKMSGKLVLGTGLFACAVGVGGEAKPAAAAETLPQFTVRERTTEPLFKAERPYEDMIIAWFNVIRRGSSWHMWYAAYDHTYRNDGDQYVCYARSKDGVTWERPRLNLVTYDGSKDNNIVIAGPRHGGVCGQTVFWDERAALYRMVFTRLAKGKWQVHSGTSSDGLRWNLSEKPLLAYNSDTQTVAFRDGDTYRLYLRMWTEGDFKGTRVVGYSEAKSFKDFSAPRQILAPEAGDPKELQYYNSAATRLAKGLYVMFPTGYRPSLGTGAPYLAVSRDGISFERMGKEPFLPLGKGFDDKMIYVAPGAVPGEEPGTYWFYYLGSKAKHDEVGAGDKRTFGNGYGRFLLGVKPPPAQ